MTTTIYRPHAVRCCKPSALTRGSSLTRISHSSRFFFLRPACFQLSRGVCCCLMAAWTALAQPQSQPPPGGVLPPKGLPANASNAEAQAQKAKREKETHDTALELGRWAISSGDYDRAIDLMTLLLKVWPEDPAAKDLLSQAQKAKGKTGPAAPRVEATAPGQPAPQPLVAAPPGLAKRRTTKHEISVSGDFLLGQGNVTMPFGFSLAKVPGLENNIVPNVAKPDRSSAYIGATLSYSYGQGWYIDAGYVQGTSSGNVDVQLGGPGVQTLPSSFKIEDKWYQAYVRYVFPRLRNKPFSAYLRAGASYVQADLTDTTVIPAFGLYAQTDKTRDLLGNLGAGVGYSVYSGTRAKLGLQFEGEGFYGQRSQDTLEVLPEAGLGFSFPKVKIDNNLYGGIGRGTVRFEYRLGKTGRVFAEGGLQGKFTLITYSSSGNFQGGNFNELLWGPYAKIGLRYAF
jgi:hypothetical protein